MIDDRLFFIFEHITPTKNFLLILPKIEVYFRVLPKTTHFSLFCFSWNSRYPPLTIFSILFDLIFSIFFQHQICFHSSFSFDANNISFEKVTNVSYVSKTSAFASLASHITYSISSRFRSINRSIKRVACTSLT